MSYWESSKLDELKTRLKHVRKACEYYDYESLQATAGNLNGFIRELFLSADYPIPKRLKRRMRAVKTAKGQVPLRDAVKRLIGEVGKVI